jgi:hypothetical protein
MTHGKKITETCECIYLFVNIGASRDNSKQTGGQTGWIYGRQEWRTSDFGLLKLAGG